MTSPLLADLYGRFLADPDVAHHFRVVDLRRIGIHLLDALEHRRVRPELLDTVLVRIAPFRTVVDHGER